MVEISPYPIDVNARSRSRPDYLSRLLSESRFPRRHLEHGSTISIPLSMLYKPTRTATASSFAACEAAANRAKAPARRKAREVGPAMAQLFGLAAKPSDSVVVVLVFALLAESNDLSVALVFHSLLIARSVGCHL